MKVKFGFENDSYSPFCTAHLNEKFDHNPSTLRKGQGTSGPDYKKHNFITFRKKSTSLSSPVEMSTHYEKKQKLETTYGAEGSHE